MGSGQWAVGSEQYISGRFSFPGAATLAWPFIVKIGAMGNRLWAMGYGFLVYFHSRGRRPTAMKIYRENPFSEFVSIQTKERHPGLS